MTERNHVYRTREQQVARNKKVGFAKQMREKLTPAEEHLWSHLISYQLDGYRFGHQWVKHGYILDFYCAAASLAVEVDGGYHLDPERAAKDKARDQHLAAIGIHTLRFTNEEVLEDVAYVLLVIAKHCRERSPSEPPTKEERERRQAGRRAAVAYRKQAKAARLARGKAIT